MSKIKYLRMYYMILFAFICCIKTPLEQEETKEEKKFNFIYKYGIDNITLIELNTFEGIFTLTRCRNPDLTIDLPLLKQEIDSINQEMVKIDFYNYPDTFHTTPDTNSEYICFTIGLS